MSRIFILTNSALAAIQGDPTANGVVDAAGNTVYEIDKLTDTPNTLVHATLKPMLTVNDYETQLATGGTSTFYALKQQLDAGLPSYYKAILYDCENWALNASNGNVPQSRTTQQGNPVAWYRMAGSLIRNYGYTAVASPSRDLANVLSSYPGGQDAGTVASNVYGQVSPFFDIIDVQAQNDQPGGPNYTLPATTFNSLVSSCCSQISGTAGHGIILCGLAVHSGDVSPFTNLQAMQTATATTAIANGCSGWWMNFNGNNAAGIAAIQALAGV